MYKVKKKVEQKKTWGIIVILFLAMSFFSILGFYDKYYYSNNDKISGMVSRINPAEGISDTVSSLIRNSDVLAYILSFVMLFCLIFVLIEQTHVFKHNVRAGAVFSIAATLLAVAFTPLVDWIVYLVSYAFFIAVLIFFLLILFLIYTFAHKRVSSEIGEISGIAAQREGARGSYLGAKGDYLEKRGDSLNRKRDYIGREYGLETISKLKPNVQEIDVILKKLNQDATVKGIRTKGDINKLFDNLSNLTQLFKAHINSGNIEIASQVHSQIMALIGRLQGEIRKKR